MTSLRPDVFEVLVPHFAEAVVATQAANKKPIWATAAAGGGRKARLTSLEDERLFILIHEKTDPLQTAHGLHFGLSQPQTNDWLQRLQPVLATALERAGYARPVTQKGRRCCTQSAIL
jgi:hypothetical protein